MVICRGEGWGKDEMDEYKCGKKHFYNYLDFWTPYITYAEKQIIEKQKEKPRKKKTISGGDSLRAPWKLVWLLFYVWREICPYQQKIKFRSNNSQSVRDPHNSAFSLGATVWAPICSQRALDSLLLIPKPTLLWNFLEIPFLLLITSLIPTNSGSPWRENNQI